LPTWQRRDSIGDFGPGLELTVTGEPVWWASQDADLRPSPEAAMSLLAPWCALEGRALQVTSPVPDDTFLGNLRLATTLMGAWWGHEPVRLVTPGAVRRLVNQVRPAADGTALFFSGGIDSFYSLVRNPDIRLLVFIAGFDVRLARRETWEAMIHSFRELAAERGLRFVAVTTNVRQHAVLGNLRWARYHGAVLAAAAHLLGNQAGRWVVSASYQRSNMVPWGSHPELDPLWSSDDVSMVHFGEDMWRAQKLAAMADKPFVHQRLRVCYADPRAEGNCGRCEKCIRTRLIYWQDLPGMLCAGMPADHTLPAALDSLPRLEMRVLVRIYRRFLDRAPPGDPVTSALKALIMRSEEASGA
jgi:hypothetical protein